MRATVFVKRALHAWLETQKRVRSDANRLLIEQCRCGFHICVRTVAGTHVAKSTLSLRARVRLA